MYIKLEKKPWYIRYRYYLAGGAVLLAGMIYVMILAAGPRRLRIDPDVVQVAEVRHADFMEYVDVEGVVQPILTLIVNTREAGNVERIVAEEGSLMKKGDTILTLVNSDLMREIEDQRDEWEKQRISYEEKEIEMEQKSLTLKQQTLDATYELNKIRKSFALEEEEYKMGIRSKAQLEVSADEYKYKTESTRLKMQSLRSDSVMTVIRKELLRNDRDRERKKLERSLRRVEDLVVRAPLDGQLSFVKVAPGQQVSAGENIAEIKVMSQFKIHTSLSEYYIDRVTTGLPAAITYQGKRFSLRVTKVVPEVKDRAFEVDLDVHVLAVRLEAGVLLVLGARVHDVGVDAVAVDLGDAERQVGGVVGAQPVDEHVETAGKAAIEPDGAQSVVDHASPPPSSCGRPRPMWGCRCPLRGPCP